MAIKSLAQTLKDLTTGIKNTVTGVTGSNATLTITKGDGTTSAVTVNNVANATKATQDSAGQQINTTYIKGLSVNGATLTITKGNGTTSIIDLIPAGTMQMFAGNTIPAGWLLCDGSAISRTDYAKLFSAIGTTWGAGDGSTTFNLPNAIGRFAEGAGSAGEYKEAGLPNIVGSTGMCPAGRDWIMDSHGALYGVNFVQGKNAYGFSSGDLWNGRNFGEAYIIVDAARSNSIYGSSTTVQPNSFTVRYIIKY